MKLPAWSELIEEQKQIYEYPLDKNLFVVGPPGSGKTTLAIQRARLIIESSKLTKIITYNRMLRRLISLTTDNNVGASTMQSFVWHHYRSLTGASPPTQPFDSYAYDWDKILEKAAVIQPRGQRLAHIVIDEGQDLDAMFFEYAIAYTCKTLTVFADDDQAISKHSSSIDDIQKAAKLENPIVLTENHRNTGEISRLAEHFHNGRLPVARVRRRIKGTLPVLRKISQPIDLARSISTWYTNFSGSIGVVVALNETGESIQNSLRSLLPNARIDMYSNSKRNEDEIDTSKSGVTILNKESVKGQEFDTVFLCDLGSFLPCDTDIKKRAMYMMCCRAKDNLIMLDGPKNLNDTALACLPGPEILKRE
jgi:superfamily I DNA/RNA helicase